MSLLDPNESSKTRASSSHDPTAALRSRAKWLLSGLDELTATRSSETAVTSPGSPTADSPFFSRIPSPIPSKHPSRSSSRNPAVRFNQQNVNASSQNNDLGATLSDLWGKSWTSIQGLASNVLGSDATVEPLKDKLNTRPTRPITSRQTTLQQRKWGPNLETTQPGAGTTEERREIIRAKKRQELLDRNGSSIVDSQSRSKRRTSDEFESISAPPIAIEDRDALVYLHIVNPEDTVAGISIKFNCQLSAIKQANRMWSNDGIQFRKVIIIPVDACNVRGRRVSNPDARDADLLMPNVTSDKDKTPTQPNFAAWGPSDRRGSISTIKPIADEDDAQDLDAVNFDEPLYRHDSWILLDGHPSAIEIARLPRRDLGYFPRPRRKSLSFSDFNSPRASGSFEFPRPSATLSETNTSRKNSNHKSRNSGGSNPFAQHLLGPGGVGSLGGKGPSLPGPAETKVEKVIQRHMPGLAPPMSAYDEERTNSSGMGLEAVGSAIEGWARRLAKAAAKAVEAPQSQRMKARVTGMDLLSSDSIELENTSEVGSEYGDEPERERGRQNGNDGLETGTSTGRPVRGGSTRSPFV